MAPKTIASRTARNRRYYFKKKTSETQTNKIPKGELRISSTVAARAAATGRTRTANPFAGVSLYPPSVAGDAKVAMDEAPTVGAWAYDSLLQTGAALGVTGTVFFGYAILAELAQRPEYRKAVETIATEMTRRWIKIQVKGDEDKSEKVARLGEAMDRFKVRDVFHEIAECDGYFGRGHLFLDIGNTHDDLELKTPIGNGWDAASKAKVSKGALKSIRSIEPMWCYPSAYNSTNPLKADWYRPQSWRVQGKEVHGSRLLTFVGREVPDLLKPAYSFGGLSLSQMMLPYVQNWLRTRQSVSDLIQAFSVFVLKTNMAATTTGAGDAFFDRVQTFNDLRTNLGVLALDKATEEFENISAQLGTLDKLQAQAQEQMASIVSIPLVKFLGITPSGLNASSDGEVRVFYDYIHATQEQLFADRLKRVIGFIQLSEFGEVDPDITFKFEPLWSMSEKEEAEVEKTRAETGQILVDTGVISPHEERKRVANDPDTQYPGLDADEMPDLREEEGSGLAVPGEAGEAALESDEAEADT